jgi:hypothetical protein
MSNSEQEQGDDYELVVLLDEAAGYYIRGPGRLVPKLDIRPDRKDIDAVEHNDPDLSPALANERAQILKVLRLYRQRSLPPDVLDEIDRAMRRDGGLGMLAAATYLVHK